ncbi:MAG: class I SAM-dependent methyltransferase [Paludibacteraceae bacterium]|nr:class I SAM-dependent methyltransferase [Paludibacteraceae bacterium]
MTLFPELEKAYSKEQFSAKTAQQLAHLYSWGPVVFQVSRLMRKYGILQMLHDSDNGLTASEIVSRTGLSDYAVKCLMEASLTMHVVLIDAASDTYRLAKVGWFLLQDELISADIDFNHDVNYEGWFVLDKSLEEGRPAGLKHFGDWPTIYEGLSSLPPQVQQSWFGFDHYYSDHSFDEAVDIIFREGGKHLLDVGGNTGKFARFVTERVADAEVTICDLKQQLGMMREQTRGHVGESRIHGYGMNLLDESDAFPTAAHYDVIWMSQFLDCFGESEIVSILRRAAQIMDDSNRLYIMETLWDRQKYTPAAFCLAMTSLYFTALANGNSKMYNTDDMTRLIQEAGLEIEAIHDAIGMGGHSILVCKKKQ